MRDRVVHLLVLVLVLAVVRVVVGVVGSLGGFLHVAPEVEQDLVVDDVTGEADPPESEPNPERRAIEGVAEECLGGGRGEIGAHEGAIDQR